MRLRPALFLLSLSLRGRRLRSLGVVAGLAVGMLALGLSVVAGLGAARSLNRHLQTMFPSQRVVLQPRNVDAFFLRFETAKITPETLAKVRALPGVRRVSPEATIRFPVSGEGHLLASAEYRTDITVTGVEPWLLDDRAPADFAYHPGRPLPAVLSEYFLDLYNMALAESNNLPKLSPAAAIGREFKLVLGDSSLRPAEESPEAADSRPAPAKVKIVPSRLVALTNNPDLLGLVLPLDAVEEFNAWYGLPDRVYRALHVELDSSESVERLKTYLPPLGLEMKDRLATWRRVLQIVRLVGSGFVALGGLVFALALAYMTSAVTSMLAQRRRELALFGALGASPRQLMALVMSEIALTSALGIALGLGGAAGGLAAADHWYRAWRAYRTFLPENLFAFPWWWVVALGVACWAIALALAWLRVALVARQPVAGMLNGER